MKRRLLRFPAITLVSSSVLLGSVLCPAAVLKSPTETVWDCTLSGGRQQGMAFIVFAEDGTFSGYQLLSTQPRSSSVSSNPRSSGGDVGRESPTPSSSVSSTNLFGFGRLTGPWRYDVKGRLIGSYAQKVGADPDVEGSGTTNSVSFTGTVVPGKRITLVASTPNGKVTYSGVPYRETPDFGGSWYATKVKGRQSFLELFDMTSLAVENPFGDDYEDLSEFPAIYFTREGQGAGYTTTGFAMLSSKKKAGFAFLTTPLGSTNSVLSAAYGSYSVSRNGTVRATTSGVEDPSQPITFKAVLTPVE